MSEGFNPYEETIAALEDEVEHEKQRAAKCRIAKAAVQATVDEKNARLNEAAGLLKETSDLLQQHKETLEKLIAFFSSMNQALGQDEDL